MTTHGLMTWGGTSSPRHSQVKKRMEGALCFLATVGAVADAAAVGLRVECLPSMQKALDFTPRTPKTTFKTEELGKLKAMQVKYHLIFEVSTCSGIL